MTHRQQLARRFVAVIAGLTLGTVVGVYAGISLGLLIGLGHNAGAMGLVGAPFGMFAVGILTSMVFTWIVKSREQSISQQSH